MKRRVGADLASGLLNLISGGVVGDALAAKRAPEKPARPAPSGEPRTRAIPTRGEIPPKRGLHENPQQALRECLYSSLARNSRLQPRRILREMLTGAAGGLLVAGVLFPALYGVCRAVCRWLGDIRWVEPSVLAIALGWFGLIFVLHRTLRNRRIDLTPNEILFLVLASKYIGGDTVGATQMIRDSRDMEVSAGVQDLLINKQTGKNLFQEAAAAPGGEAQCHP